MKKKVTIHDLALILNIDSSTVSRALADSPRVKQKTRDLIQAKAKELGYSRNTLASNLRAQKTHTIGVIVPHISRFFLSTVIAGIEEIAYKKGYRVIICQSLDQLGREQEMVRALLSSQVDGIILSISMETDQFEHLESIQQQGIPVVFFDRKCDAIAATNITIDDFKMAFEATEHLIQNGCQHIVHFAGSQKTSIYQNRLKGYLAALDKHGIKKNDTLILESRLKPADGERMAKEILGMSMRPDGIFSANDLAAISAMQVFHEHGIQIPSDIAIIGFSNEPLGAYTNPPLSSVNQNPYLMGKTAIESLLDQIENKVISDEKLEIISELIIRKSSAVKS